MSAIDTTPKATIIKIPYNRILAQLIYQAVFLGLCKPANRVRTDSAGDGAGAGTGTEAGFSSASG